MRDVEGKVCQNQKKYGVLDSFFPNLTLEKTIFPGFSVSVCQLMHSRHGSLAMERNGQAGLLSYAFIRLAYLLHAVANNTVVALRSTNRSKAYFCRHAALFQRHSANLSKQCKYSARVITTDVILLCGDIHLNPGPVALQLKSLPDFFSLTAADLRMIHTLSDGLCLLHATSLSLRHLHGLHISTRHLVDLGSRELHCNATDYLPFGFANVTELQRLTDCYIRQQSYNTLVGDIAPLAIANALCIRITSLTA